MALNLTKTSKKLVQALNSRGYRLTVSLKPFYDKKGTQHSFYSVNESHWDADKGKYVAKEIYGSCSLLRIVLYLRDMWYTDNGWELPTDQEKWNRIREQLKEKQDG